MSTLSRYLATTIERLKLPHFGRPPRPAGSAQQVEISRALLIKAGDLAEVVGSSLSNRR
jgi:hypothetical protein